MKILRITVEEGNTQTTRVLSELAYGLGDMSEDEAAEMMVELAKFIEDDEMEG